MKDNASEQCPELFQILGAWLHQDWDLDHSTAEDALQASVSDVSMERLRAALSELEGHRPAPADEEATRRFVNALCEYHPPGDGLTYVAWLDHVELLLREAVAA